MSPSSSDSWRGTGGADIIDLDRYMRGSVRPSRTVSGDGKLCERLVVDAGGVSRKPRSIPSGSQLSQASNAPDARFKRYSHDSGVSDGSYQRPRRTHRTHRRSNYQDNTNTRMTREIPALRMTSGRADSSSSLREFRRACEKALIEQQKQIARVAQMCEQLTERAGQNERSEKCVQHEQFERKQCKEKIVEVLSDDTSEITSSSRSTKQSKNELRKDKHRTQECKTYKIIMNKLDELNHLFKTRPPRTVPPRRAAPRLAAGGTPAGTGAASSTSVSVCDKLIATDPQRTIIVNRVMTPRVQVCCGNTSFGKKNTNAPSLGSTARSSRYSRTKNTHVHAVTQAFAVDIAPQGPQHPNVITESIVKCESSSLDSHHSKADPRCGFDLEDPVHLYTQAKKLTMTATTRRAASLERGVSPRSSRAQLCGHARSSRSHSSSQRSPSLCAVCRAYCRYLRECIDPLFGWTDGCKC